MTMTLIETKTLGADAASIEFTSIPQTFTDLFALCSVRSSHSASDVDLFLRINGDSGNNYGKRRLIGNGSTVSSDSLTSTDAIRLGNINAATSTASTFSSVAFTLPNYAGATTKSLSSDSVSENNATAALQMIIASSWSDTAAVTSINFLTFSDFVAGSTISLYGITKGSDGIVTTS
jgi:hypothetical protein